LKPPSPLAQSLLDPEDVSDFKMITSKVYHNLAFKKVTKIPLKELHRIPPALPVV